MATKSQAPRQDTLVRFATNPPASQWGSGRGRPSVCPGLPSRAPLKRLPCSVLRRLARVVSECGWSVSPLSLETPKNDAIFDAG